LLSCCALSLLCPLRRILTPSLQELRQLQLEDNATTSTALGQQQQQQQQQQLQHGPQQQHSGSTSAGSDMQTSEDAALYNMHVKADIDAAVVAVSYRQDAAAAAGPALLLEAAAAQGAAMSPAFAPLSAAHVAYRQRLDEQERRSARINTLLRKDFLHRMCFCGYVYGEHGVQRSRRGNC
jgi:hypothetical protein